MKKIINNIMLVALLICALSIPSVIVNAAEIASSDSAVVIIEKYEIVEGGLKPGEQITLKLKLKNASTLYGAKNTVLTIESVDGSLTSIYGDDNQVYIGTIEPQKTVDVEIKAMVNKQYNADNARIKCYFTYMSDEPLSNSVFLDIPTNALGNLVVEAVKVANKATVDVKTLISIRCKNNGIVSITDAKLMVDGNVADNNKEIQVNEIGAGKTVSNDYEISFVESGMQDLDLQIQYTDLNGATCVVECGEYKVNVVENATEVINDTVVELADGGTYAIPVCILAVVFIMIVGLTVIYIRSRR